MAAASTLSTRQRLVTILLTAVTTALVILIGINLSMPDNALDWQIKHKHSIADPQFKREMSVLLGPSIVGGNSIKVLNNGDEIFPPMLKAIRSATQTITFETYIYWSGDIGMEFADALIDRARAGVEVKIIIDWLGGQKMEESLLKRMNDAGVDIVRYRPLHWYDLARMNNRTHRKLLVVDGRIGYTGGVGVADVWLGHAQDKDHWRDLHFEIEGPVVSQLQAAFNDNWIEATGELLDGPMYFPEQSPAGTMDAQLFLASPSEGSRSMHLMYLMAIAAAVKSIDLQAAYFVPDDLVLSQMQDALDRGVRIRIMVPGEHIDSESVRVASKSLWGDLLAKGAEIYIYQPTMMHNKMFIADRELVSVGSTNFDVRSFRLNDEASLNIYDTDFAEEMTLLFETDLQHTQRYSHEEWQNRPFSEKFTEAVVRPIRSQL